MSNPTANSGSAATPVMFRIGKFTLFRLNLPASSVYIQCDGGEGGQFDEMKLAEWIEQFYRANF